MDKNIAGFYWNGLYFGLFENEYGYRKIGLGFSYRNNIKSKMFSLNFYIWKYWGYFGFETRYKDGN